MTTQEMKRYWKSAFVVSGLVAVSVLMGCALEPEGEPEPTSEQAWAFTGANALANAQSWCIGDNGNSPAPHTFSGTSHAATFYSELQSIEAAVVSSTYTDSTVSQINESNGTYNVDCSSFVDYVMCDPMVDTLATVGGSGRPRAVDYYNWIVGGGSGITRITDVRDIRAGDIIAVKYPTTGCTSVTGHMMVAGGAGSSVGAVVSTYDAGRSRYDVPVYDATSTPSHTSDFRQNGGAIGGGIISLAYDGSFAPTLFYWSINASSPSPIACYPGQVSSVAIARFND